MESRMNKIGEKLLGSFLNMESDVAILNMYSSFSINHTSWEIQKLHKSKAKANKKQ